jgi:hypothetical protein
LTSPLGAAELPDVPAVGVSSSSLGMQAPRVSARLTAATDAAAARLFLILIFEFLHDVV